MALLVGVYIVRPRFILSDFSSFLGRHPVGSAVNPVAPAPARAPSLRPKTGSESFAPNPFA